MIKLLKLLTKRDWILLVLALALIAAGVWMDLQVPSYMGRMTQLITTGYYVQPNFTYMTPGVPAQMWQVWRYGGLMMAYTAGGVATGVIVTLLGAFIASSLSMRIRQKVWLKVGDFSKADINKFSIPSLITRNTNDVTQVQTFVALAIQAMIRAPILIIWAGIRMATGYWQLSLIPWVSVAAILLMAAVILIFCIPQFKKIRVYTDKINQEARENLSGIRVVRAYNAESFEEDKFNKSNAALAKSNLTMNRAVGIAMPFLMLIMGAFTGIIYWIGAYMINSNIGAYGDLVYSYQSLFFAQLMVFLQYAFQIIGAFILLVYLLTMAPGAIVSAKRINEVLQTKSSIVDDVKTDIKLDNAFVTDGTIKFANVNYRYPDAEANVLDDINIEIKRGSTVAFIGSTGSGKSTLVNLLPRIADPTNGLITIGGVNIHDIPQEEVNDFVGYVPQTATLFSGSIRDNIAFGTVKGQEITDDAVEDALRISQSKEFVSNLNEGVNHVVKQRGRNFSGGQKQRLSIARTIARRPKVIIFDDTFSALDYKTDKALRDSIKQELSGTTVLIVAQRIGTIKNADQIFVLDKGQIVGSGRHKDLLKSCDVYNQIARSQLTEEELAS